MQTAVRRKSIHYAETNRNEIKLLSNILLFRIYYRSGKERLHFSMFDATISRSLHSDGRDADLRKNVRFIQIRNLQDGISRVTRATSNSLDDLGRRSEQTSLFKVKED